MITQYNLADYFSNYIKMKINKFYILIKSNSKLLFNNVLIQHVFAIYFYNTDIYQAIITLTVPPVHFRALEFFFNSLK